MRALVTGGAGFIGSHVADRFLRDGYTVTAVDNFDPYYDPAQKRRNVAQAQSNDSYRLVEADVADGAAVTRAFEMAEPDIVVHLAAKAGVRASVDDPASYIRVNELGGLHLLDACKVHGTAMAFASTSSVYGNTSRVPFVEDDYCDRPLSPYAASKRGAEMMVHAYHDLYDLPIAILRFFTVYGPRGRPDMAVAKFTRQLWAGETITLHGEETERDFTFIDDIVDGVMGAVAWVGKGRRTDTFNLGRSEPVRVTRLIELMGKALGVEPRVQVGRLQPGESKVTSANVSKAAGAFDYEPKVSLEEGIARWVEWLDGPEAPPRDRGPG